MINSNNNQLKILSSIFFLLAFVHAMFTIFLYESYCKKKKKTKDDPLIWLRAGRKHIYFLLRALSKSPERTTHYNDFLAIVLQAYSVL